MIKIITNEKQLHKLSIECNYEDAKSIVMQLKSVLKRGGAIGLCAPQIGILKRVICFADGEVMINPIIIKRDSKETEYPEGCLSIPKTIKHNIKITRPKKIKVKFVDINNEINILKYDGLKARAIQHEVDHLDGVLITDKGLI